MAKSDFNREILIKTLYESIWKARSDWQKDLIQYIIIVVGVFTVIRYGLEHGHMFAATVLSQFSVLWILAMTMVASYNYRQFQMISSRIEIINKLNESRVVLPGSFNNIKSDKPFSLPDIYKIHFTIFGLMFLIVSAFYVRFAASESSISTSLGTWLIILPIIIPILATLFFALKKLPKGLLGILAYLAILIILFILVIILSIAKCSALEFPR